MQIRMVVAILLDCMFLRYRCSRLSGFPQSHSTGRAWHPTREATENCVMREAVPAVSPVFYKSRGDRVVFGNKRSPRTIYCFYTFFSSFPNLKSSFTETFFPYSSCEDDQSLKNVQLVEPDSFGPGDCIFRKKI